MEISGWLKSSPLAGLSLTHCAKYSGEYDASNSLVGLLGTTALKLLPWSWPTTRPTTSSPAQNFIIQKVNIVCCGIDTTFANIKTILANVTFILSATNGFHIGQHEGYFGKHSFHFQKYGLTNTVNLMIIKHPM